MATIQQTMFKIEVTTVELQTIISALRSRAHVLSDDMHCSDEQGHYNQEEADRISTLIRELKQAYQ